MAQFSSNTTRIDPYKNFKFQLAWEDGTVVAGVSKVSALKRTTEVVSHREGGDVSTPRHSPGKSSFEPITVERGVMHDPAFEEWSNLVYSTSGDAAVSLAGYKRNLLLNVFNLLPFMPLDGGRLLQLTIFMRRPLLETLFRLFAVAGLGLGAWLLGFWVLGIIAAVMLVLTPMQHRQAQQRRLLREREPDLPALCLQPAHSGVGDSRSRAPPIFAAAWRPPVSRSHDRSSACRAAVRRPRVLLRGTRRPARTPRPTLPGSGSGSSSSRDQTSPSR